MLPDPGSYEERYSLTGAALSLAAALLSVSLGLLWHTHLIFAALTVLLAIPTVLAAVRRPVAFRADHAGITLGSEWQLPRRVMVIPWADVEKIILYSGYTSSGDQAQYIGVQRPQGAPALPYGNKQAPWCPVPGVAAGATRRIKNWRLDSERQILQRHFVIARMRGALPVVAAMSSGWCGKIARGRADRADVGSSASHGVPGPAGRYF